MAIAKKFLTGIDLNGQKINNVGDGSAAADVATYGQLLNLVNGLNFKSAVQAASTTNVVTTAPGATIDGYALKANDRVLLKDQTLGVENGIWVWTGATSALTRATDANGMNLPTGSTVVVINGTANMDTQWTLNTPAPITVGTTALTWVKSGAAGQTYTTGNGVAITGAQISAVAAPSGGVTVGATGIAIDTNVVARKAAGTVGDGTSTSFTFTHNWGTRDVIVQLYDTTTYEDVNTYTARSTANSVTLNFSTAPTSGQYRVVVYG